MHSRYVNNAPKNDTGAPELLFSSPDIIDISINGSIAYLDKNGKVSLYDTEKNKQEEIGYVPNSKSIIIPYNNEKYDFYVLTNNTVTNGNVLKSKRCFEFNFMFDN